jgi:hypothetical protein
MHHASSSRASFIQIFSHPYREILIHFVNRHARFESRGFRDYSDSLVPFGFTREHDNDIGLEHGCHTLASLQLRSSDHCPYDIRCLPVFPHEAPRLLSYRVHRESKRTSHLQRSDVLPLAAPWVVPSVLRQSSATD